MVRDRSTEIMRHESFIEDDDSGNSSLVKVSSKDMRGGKKKVDGKTTGKFPAQQPKQKPGKGKRSTEDMLASMPNEMAQALYAMERIAALEDQIVNILSLCTPKALSYILEQRKSLKRYAPED